MSCLIDTGRKVGCKDKAPGIRRLFFVNNGLLDLTVAADEITVLSGSALSVYQVDLFNSNADFTETINNTEDGSPDVEQELNVTLFGKDKASRLFIEKVRKNIPHVIVEDVNGQLWLLGEVGGMHFGGSALSGRGSGDVSGYELTGTSRQRQLAYPVDPDALFDDVNITIVVGS